MGFLRTILALSVVLYHCGGIAGFEMLGGVAAVQAFFIISGFFMTMVLNEKYSRPQDNLLFYVNRFLRIFGAYWFILLVSAAFFLLDYSISHNSRSLFGPKINVISELRFSTQAYLAFTHLLILGQDFGNFLAVSPSGLLYWTDDYTTPWLPVYKLQFVPQAWTLALELYFYALAPWLVRGRLLIMVSLATGCFAARFAAAYYGKTFDPWTYRFFPFELGWFLVGSLSYRLHKIYSKQPRAHGVISKVACAALLLFSIFYQLPNHYVHLAGFHGLSIAYLVVLALILPVLFAITSRAKIDRVVGELSYPLYLVHILVICVYDRIAGRELNTLARPIVVVALSLVLSYAISRWLDAPIDRFRASVPQLLPSVDFDDLHRFNRSPASGSTRAS